MFKTENRMQCSGSFFCCKFYYRCCCHHSHGHCRRRHYLLSVYTADCDLFLESVLMVPKYDNKVNSVPFLNK
jgi:hypothetical protein